MKVVGIIPARYGSTRFPGKPLANILGKSMIQRVYEQCQKCKTLTDILVATDDDRILNHVKNFNGRVIMTSKTHENGTERCNEALKKLKIKADIIINIQGDEPFINPLQIDEITHLFEDPKTKIGTLAKKITDKKIINNINNPKVIFNKNKIAINFCRNISNISKTSTYYKHIGIYGYKKNILEEISQLPKSQNEIKKQLEQLRWLDNSYPIKVGITTFETISIDTPDDIENIKDRIR